MENGGHFCFYIWVVSFVSGRPCHFLLGGSMICSGWFISSYLWAVFSFLALYPFAI